MVLELKALTETADREDGDIAPAASAAVPEAPGAATAVSLTLPFTVQVRA